MTMRGNPYEAADVLGEFSRGWGFVDQVRDTKQARIDAKEDREYQRVQRGREGLAFDQSQEDRTADAPIRSKQRETTLAQLDEYGRDAPVREAQRGLVLSQASDYQADAPVRSATRADSLAQLSEAPENRRMARDTAKINQDAARVGLEGAKIGNKAQSLELQQKQEAQTILEQFRRLQSSPVSSLDDEQQATDMQDLAMAIRSGSPLENASPKMLGILNKTFADRLTRGIGETRPGSKDTIVGKKIIDVVEPGNDYKGPIRNDIATFELEVTAKRPDGTTYTYTAPATEKASTADDDAVLQVPIDDLENTLDLSVGALQEAQQQGMKFGDYRQKMMEERAAQYQMLTGKDILTGRAAESPYFTTVQTSRGIGQQNARTGKFEILKDEKGNAYLPPGVDPDAQGAVAEAKETGKGRGEVVTDTSKKVRNAKSTLSLLDEADGLIPQATGSGVGNIVDASQAAFGKSNQGAEAIGRLKVIAAALAQNVPRMEGPQSDADRKLYQEAAGNLGDPTLPAPRKKAAAETVRRLQEKYIELNSDEPSSAPAKRRFTYIGRD